jgi:ribose transport system substrate-binding protein
MKKTAAKRIAALVLSATVFAGCIGCSGKSETASSGAGKSSGSASSSAETADKKYVIGFSQRSMDNPLLVAMVNENIEYAKKNYPNIEFITTDANGSTSKQVSDMEDLIAKKVDLIMISPQETGALTDVTKRAMDAGIKVVAIDRNVDTEVTSFVGADNKPMGAAAAKVLNEELNGKGSIIEIQGTAGASATLDRSAGFNNYIKENCPDMKVVATQYCNFNRNDGMKYMEDMLQRFKSGEITAVYAHNDEMALGAYEAIKAANRLSDGIKIASLDGTEVGIEAVKAGKLVCTDMYPYGAPEGIETAYKILTGKQFDKNLALEATLITKDNVDKYIGKGK